MLCDISNGYDSFSLFYLFIAHDGRSMFIEITSNDNK